jgi:hypothetical protein
MQHVASEVERCGPLIIFVNVLLAQAGLPGFPILLAAGALVTQTRYQLLGII